MLPGPITSQTFPPEYTGPAGSGLKVFSKEDPRDREFFQIAWDLCGPAFDSEVERLLRLASMDPGFRPTVVQWINEWGGVEKEQEIARNE